MFGFGKSRKFRKAIERALEDHVITDQEVELIDRLQSDLGLSDEKAQAEYEKQVMSLVRRLTDQVISRVQSTRRFSPDDEEELKEICERLKVKPQIDLDSFQMYRKL